MAGPIALQFDIGAYLSAQDTQGERVVISAWLFVPDAPPPPDRRPAAFVLTAGGSYDKRYHHVVIPGHRGYSAAEHLAGLGNVVLLADHLGVGESSRLPDQKRATRQVVALANHIAAGQFFAALRAGTLHGSLAAMSDFVRIGGGHSMGGMQTIIQQANHRTYHAIMVIGYTAEGVHLTMNGQKLRAADFIPEDGPDYTRSDRAPLHEGFHWDDVPAEVIAADDALAVETPACIGLDSIRTGIVRDEAARIDAPLFICLSERDVSPDPYAEPGYYRSSRDITLQVLPRAGHCQSFASTRHLLWDRMHHWAHAIAGSV